MYGRCLGRPQIPVAEGAPDTLGGGPFNRVPLQRVAGIPARPATPPRCLLP